MLDLNLDLDSKEVSGAVLNQMDESVTSNSSLVNAEASSCIDGEEEMCSAPAVKFQFEILKGGGREGEEGRSEVMTKEFFPVEKGGSFVDLSGQSSRSSVDISFQRGNQGGDAARVTQPPAQPVKKSRRGPRSKSSQYRGVTFYRRTGRWESHIWDCGKQVYLGGFDTAHAAARLRDGNQGPGPRACPVKACCGAGLGLHLVSPQNCGPRGTGSKRDGSKAGRVKSGTGRKRDGLNLRDFEFLFLLHTTMNCFITM